MAAERRPGFRLRRFLRALLYAYPHAFRTQHGQALLDTMLDLYAARMRGAGVMQRAHYWLVTSRDLLWSAFMLRLEFFVLARARRHGWRSPVQPDASAGRVSARGVVMRSVVQDAGFAIRSLRRRPLFAGLIVATLSLGLGANTAVYSLVDALLLDPVPVHRPQETVAVFEALGSGARFEGTAYPNYRYYRERARTLTGLAAFGELDAGLVAGEHTQRIELGAVSGNYFEVLGLRPAAGRLLRSFDEAAPGSTPHVVLGHSLWQRSFGRDPRIVGRDILLNGAPFTVVGVAPARFRGTALGSEPEAWIPITMVEALSAGGTYESQLLSTRYFQWLRMVGRLRSGSQAADVERELSLLATQLRGERRDEFMPDMLEPSITVTSVAEGATIASRSELLRFVTLLGVVAFLTLLIAIFNVANLMLARGVERVREIGIRTALGAGRARLVRQLLVESSVLAVAGGAVGVAVAAATFALLRTFTLPGGVEVSSLPLALRADVLFFAATAAIIAVLGFGLLPALHATRGDVGRASLTHGNRSSNRAGMARAALVAGQLALSLVLLVGASLIARSVAIALRTELGFDARHVAAVAFGLRQHGYDAARGQRFFQALLDEVKARPGVTAAALGRHVPVSENALMIPVTVPGSIGNSGERQRAAFNAIAGDYFAVLTIPLLQGRLLTSSDDAPEAPSAAVVNETAARAFWPGENAIGRIVRVFSRDMTVVGVVADAKYHRLGEEELPYVYTSAMHSGAFGVLDRVNVIARGTDASRTLWTLHDAIGTLDPRLPTFDGRRVADQLDRVLMPQRFALRLLGVFGALALLVSAVGMYGLVAYTVAQRTQEIGIRMALGASTANVLTVVTRATVTATIGGVALGLLGALLTTRLLSAFLFGITATDLPAFALGTAVLLAAAALASIVPARRATRIDPVRAIQQ